MKEVCRTLRINRISKDVYKQFSACAAFVAGCLTLTSTTNPNHAQQFCPNGHLPSTVIRPMQPVSDQIKSLN
jgi:hypothetical protein